MSFNFDDPIIVMNRTAPYPLKTDIFTIINGKIQLAEKPDSFLRFPEVKNTVDNSLYYEIKSGIPENNQFICDYTNSLLTFNSSQNGKTISAQYHSMGVAFIPVSKIYTVENNGSVTETLDQTLTNNINTLNNSTEDAIDTINTTKDNAVNTIITTKNDTISTVNVTSEDTIDEINNLLGTATNIINDGISQINYDKNTSKYYIDSITGNAIQEINNVTTETLSTIDSKINDFLNLCNGHDFQKAFALYITYHSKKGISSEKISEAFRLTYRFDDFKDTTLYVKLKEWSDKNNIELFKDI